MDLTEYETAVSHMVEAAELARQRRAELLERLAGVFSRAEPAAQAGKYLDRLCDDLPRKNGWTLAERAGDTTPDKMQRLLYDAVWDHQQAMERVRGFAIGYLADPDAVLVLDESGQEKSGTATVGVKRQYVGCAGKIANAVNVVYASYAGRAGHAVVAARLYLPQEWAEDAGRRKRARVPDHVTFKTKPQLAVEMLAELHAEDRLPLWVSGDEVYGQNPTLRSWCETQRIGYVLGIPRSFTVTLGCGTSMRAEKAVALVSADGWKIPQRRAGLQGRSGLHMGVARHRRGASQPAGAP